MGQREVTGSITMPWTDATKYLETEYEGYNKYGHIVSEMITNKQIWFKAGGSNILRTSNSNTLGTGETIVKTVVENEGESNETTTYTIDTGIPYSCLIKFPEVEVTNVESPKSGSDAKELTLEFKVLEKPSQSYMTVDMVSALSALHIDSTGTSLDALKPASDWPPED